MDLVGSRKPPQLLLGAALDPGSVDVGADLCALRGLPVLYAARVPVVVLSRGPALRERYPVGARELTEFPLASTGGPGRAEESAGSALGSALSE